MRSKIADWVTIASVGQLVVKYFIAYIEVEFLMKYFHIWPEILAAITVAVFIFSKIYFRKTATPQSPTVSTIAAAPAQRAQPDKAPDDSSCNERRKGVNILDARKKLTIYEAAAMAKGLDPELYKDAWMYGGPKTDRDGLPQNVIDEFFAYRDYLHEAAIYKNTIKYSWREPEHMPVFVWADITKLFEENNIFDKCFNPNPKY